MKRVHFGLTCSFLLFSFSMVSLSTCASDSFSYDHPSTCGIVQHTLPLPNPLSCFLQYDMGSLLLYCFTFFTRFGFFPPATCIKKGKYIGTTMGKRYSSALGLSVFLSLSDLSACGKNPFYWHTVQVQKQASHSLLCSMYFWVSFLTASQYRKNEQLGEVRTDCRIL